MTYFPEIVLEIHHIIRDPQISRSDSPCVLHGGKTAAAAVLLLTTSALFILPDLHGDSDHLVPLFLQQPGSCGRIHAAGHANDNRSVFTLLNIPLLPRAH